MKIPEKGEPNCLLKTGLRPCLCDLPRCPVCNYTEHDAVFEMDHCRCSGTIPGRFDPVAEEVVGEAARTYPCHECGKMRSKAEGGTVFTVCDECWDRLHPKAAPEDKRPENDACGAGLEAR